MNEHDRPEAEEQYEDDDEDLERDCHCMFDPPAFGLWGDGLGAWDNIAIISNILVPHPHGPAIACRTL
jgi:hypothetical protein